MLLIHADYQGVNKVVDIRLSLTRSNSVWVSPCLQKHFYDIIQSKAACVLKSAHLLDVVSLILPQDGLSFAADFKTEFKIYICQIYKYKLSIIQESKV